MRPRKSSKKPASRSSAKKQNTEQDLPTTGVPTWPRLDLLAPEQMLTGLRDWGNLILASEKSPANPFSKHPSPPIFSDKDREILRQAVQQLRTAEPELFALLAQVSVLSREATLARKLLELTASTAGAAFVIGVHGGMADTARGYFQKSQASLMQYRKATSEKERAITDAIKAELEASGGTIPSGNPHKDADAIRDGVNKRLEALGHGPLSVLTIYRRLRRS
jgi:hypothetical protein